MIDIFKGKRHFVLLLNKAVSKAYRIMDCLHIFNDKQVILCTQYSVYSKTKLVHKTFKRFSTFCKHKLFALTKPLLALIDVVLNEKF